MIYSLSHVALSVADMERSLAFYRDGLGMKLIMDLNMADDRMGKLIGISGAACRIVHLKLGDGILELFYYTQPAGQNLARRMRQCDHGFSHIGFEVDEFWKEIDRLKQMNVEFLGEPIEVRPNVWVVYFRGPDGEVCEYRQQPRTSGQA